MTVLKAPFPYFGGKSRAARIVWERLGNPPNYVEPFFGSGAVLLAREDEPRTETVNDIDGLLANYWRSVQKDPEQTAYFADWPVNEIDLHARHRYLRASKPLVAELLEDPEAYDPKLAGWWVWGISQWIGSGWCPPPSVAEVTQLPHLGTAGMGVHRAARPDQGTWKQRPHLTDQGMGVQSARVAGGLNGTDAGLHRKRPHLMTNGRGISSDRVSIGTDAQLPELRGDSGATGSGIHASAFASKTGGIYAYFEALSARLRRVRVCCGDWSRVLGPSVTWRHGVTGVFLDPPYSPDERDKDLYSHDGDVAVKARAWAIENGNNPLLRIALCGYEGEHEMPSDWVTVRWKAAGGYGSQGTGRGRENADREVIWFSPHCLGLEALPLFKELYQ